MGKIYRENLWESQQFKIMSANNPPAPSGGGWMGHPITTRGRWRVVSDREFSKFLRSLEQFIQTVKGQNNFW